MNDAELRYLVEMRKALWHVIKGDETGDISHYEKALAAIRKYSTKRAKQIKKIIDKKLREALRSAGENSNYNINYSEPVSRVPSPYFTITAGNIGDASGPSVIPYYLTHVPSPELGPGSNAPILGKPLPTLYPERTAEPTPIPEIKPKPTGESNWAPAFLLPKRGGRTRRNRRRRQSHKAPTLRHKAEYFRHR